MKKEKYFIIGYLTIELVIYIAFVSLDLTAQYSIPANHILKYVGLLLCPGFLILYQSLLRLKKVDHNGASNLRSNSQKNTSKENVLLTKADTVSTGIFDTTITIIALCFTAFSDYFLLIRNDHFLIGVLSFIVVQTLYMVRIGHMSGRKLWKELLIRSGIFAGIGVVAAVIICNSGMKLSKESLITAAAAAWYIFNLIMNVIGAGILAIKKGKVYPASVVLAIGLIFFLGCDLCVGGNNLNAYGIKVTPMLQRFINVAMWAFYLPSQVMITMSAINRK